jgi:polyphosphate kinase
MPQKPIIRDLSWLAFNQRVIQEAKDPHVHLYDRLRFLGIFSNNLDEFYRVRVGTLNKMLHLKEDEGHFHLEQNPKQILKDIQDTTVKLQKSFDATFAEIIRELAKQHRIYFKNDKQLNKEQKYWVTQYFEEKVRTQIVPLMIESMPHAPMLKDRSIYLACLMGNDQNPMLQRYALIQIPEEQIPRFAILPSPQNETHIILLEDIIRFNLKHLFAPFGFNQFQSHIIKVTRDAEMDLDNDINSNLIEVLEKNLKKRTSGKATRFVYDKKIDPQLLEYLINRLDLSDKSNLIPGQRIHNFKAFMDFPKAVFKDLVPRPKPFVHPLLKQPCRIMDVIDKRDVMLHFPYHSFSSVIDLLREAAIDPSVQSIKITVYRLAKDSKVINALLNAVRNGKKVSVIVELKARFDEEANLYWKGVLEEEGVQVFVGVPHMKVHAKLCVIKKREMNRTIQYGFISTGNFHEGTAQVYGDHLLLTTKPQIISDICKIFECLESEDPQLQLLNECKTLITSPFQMRNYFIDRIREAASSEQKNKKITVKLNSLVDDILIQSIYEAAEKGVKIELIIRGICTAITQQKRFKKKITAISIVDQYLEHARVFLFSQGDDVKTYISSADWMVRNLDHRIEVACPIFSKTLQRELQDILKIQLKENVKARILDNKQLNHYVAPTDKAKEFRSQVEIYHYLKSKKYEN